MILSYIWKKLDKVNVIKIVENEHKLSDVDTHKKEIVEELEITDYKNLEDMLFRMEITYSEIEKILDVIYIPTSSLGYTLPTGIYKISEIKLMLMSLLPDKVKENIKNDGTRLKSSLTTAKTIRFTKKSFFYTILGFTQSHSGILAGIEGFVQLIPGSYKNDKPINITAIDKLLLKTDCVNGSIINGIREPILYSFELDKPPRFRFYKEPRIKLF